MVPYTKGRFGALGVRGEARAGRHGNAVAGEQVEQRRLVVCGRVLRPCVHSRFRRPSVEQVRG